MSQALRDRIAELESEVAALRFAAQKESARTRDLQEQLRKPSCAQAPEALTHLAISEAEQTAALLPNGVAATNIYQAYEAGLTEAAAICDRLTFPDVSSEWECATLDCELAILRVRDSRRVRDADAKSTESHSQ